MSKNHLFFLGIFLFSSSTLAQDLGGQNAPPDSDWSVDQKVGLVGRSYPAGAQALYTLGSNYLAWGDPTQWKYGYFRAALNAATSAVINRVGVEFQFYPISIFGLSAGYDWGERWYKPKFVDCSIYDCLGRVDRAYLKAQLMLAYSKFIFVGQIKYEELKHLGGGPLFFDEVTLLPGQSDQEHVVIYNPTLLYTLNEKYKVGVTSILSEGITSNSMSHLWGPLIQYAFDSRSQIAVGFGQNHSTLVHNAFCAFLMGTYTIDPSLSIVDLVMRKSRNKEF